MTAVLNQAEATVIVAVIGAVAAIVSAYIANVRGKTNSREHGEVVTVLTRVEEGQRHLETRVGDVADEVRDLHAAHERHLEHHLDQENPR